MKEIKSIRLDNAEKQQIEIIKLYYFKNLNLKLNTSEIIRNAISTLYEKIKSNI